MVLVPKKEGPGVGVPDDLKDFGPFNLMGSIYEVLANGLRKMMSKVVSLA